MKKKKDDDTKTGSELGDYYYDLEMKDFRFLPARELKQLLQIDLADISTLPQQQARYLVNHYYILQKARVRSKNQVKALRKVREPHRLISEVAHQSRYLELNLKAIMLAYAATSRPGRWMMSIRGIGAVLSASLLAYIDITNKPTVGNLWRFAGFDPSVEWIGRERAKKLVKDAITKCGGPGAVLRNDGGVHEMVIAEVARRTNRKAERLYKLALWYSRDEDDEDDEPVCSIASLIKAVSSRPWNQRLRSCCWNLGECLIKVGGPDNIYTQLIAERKILEVDRNERGLNQAACEREMERKQYGKHTKAYSFYTRGLLPPQHVHARARRYGIKLFLAHLHHVMWWEAFNRPPVRPYILEHSDGKHTRFIEIPNFPFEGLGAGQKGN
jgi:hypothetical protein